ncbi:MAG: CCA tRNA nucleotidyltransferase [Bdellovibrionota bacterium]
MSVLRDQGFKAFFAGGCVRDAFIGRIPKDLDVATDAPPETVEGLFERTVATGKAFGVIRVLPPKAVSPLIKVSAEHAAVEVEVATFRAESDYHDGRHPGKVAWVSDREDALRRDFTVNALFYDLSPGTVIDHVGGIDDIQNKILRTVGAPKERFSEDHLRLLRALRFSFDLGFPIEKATSKAIQEHVDLIKSVSRERIKDELGKILQGPAPIDGLIQGDSWGFWDALFSSGTQRFQSYKPHQDFFKKQSVVDQWSLFHWMLNVGFPLTHGIMEKAKDTIARLSHTKSEQKEILAFHRYFSDIEDWIQSPLAKCLIEWKKPTFRLFVLWLDQIFPANNMQSEPGNWARKMGIEIYKRNFENKMPEPLLNGEDLKSLNLEGPQVGILLDEAYGQQLENGWTAKSQALQWLQHGRTK